MKFILPFVIAIIIASAVSGKVHEVFSSGIATALDVVIYFSVFFVSYKLLSYLRNL